MMNDEMNIHDEFEDWLKQSADKHRMYPSDKLWRNINEQLHEQPNWPALTFGAILTMALITATLVFLHPTKNVFTLPKYAYTSTPAFTDKKSESFAPEPQALQPLEPVRQKTPTYVFNSSLTDYTPDLSSDEIVVSQMPEVISPAMDMNHDELQSVATLQSIPAERMNKSAVETTTLPVASLSLNEEIKTLSATTTIQEEKTQESTQAELSSTAKRLVRLPQAHTNRWHLEVYGGSNISYRRLRETMFDDHTSVNRSVSSGQSNLNNIVSQKPSVGINAGIAFVYAVSNRLRLKTGVQFNFRQYAIDAYKSGYERSMLLLNNGMYYPDSIYTYSAISNAQGKAISLSNKYYQIGIPVGLEWTAVKLQKLHFDIAANVQPTYQINSNNYLLTSDYKNYVKAPGLLRRININAGLEATANFTAGKLQWQVGPQILYQTMPTQKANYSIHEHLIDYGIRVGLIKRL